MRFIATALFVAALAISAQDAPKQDAPKKGGGKGFTPKNLKILQPGPELGQTMRAFTVALGQRCDFCHVQGDNSLDDKPQKLTARKMLEMTSHINEGFADGKVHVTCYTCHRGKNMPETTPPPATPGQ